MKKYERYERQQDGDFEQVNGETFDAKKGKDYEDITDQVDSGKRKFLKDTRDIVVAALAAGSLGKVIQMVGCSDKQTEVRPLEIPAKEKLEPVSIEHGGEFENGTEFLGEAIEFISHYSEQKMTEYEKKIADYKAKNWKIDKAVKSLETYSKSLTQLTDYLVDHQNKEQLDESLTLANIVYNETSGINKKAAEAIIHAWLNRKGAGTIPENTAEISDYLSLGERFESIESDGQKYQFLKKLLKTTATAEEIMKLDDDQREAADPTNGATHWISPKSLIDAEFDENGDLIEVNGYYVREFGIETVDENGNTSNRRVKKYCPNWARKNTDFKQNRYEDWLNDDYKEISVPGVEKKDFYFYKGVKSADIITD